MSTAPSTSTASSAPQAQQPTTSNANPHLLPLQEDDEFEEFPVEDWKADETYGAKLGKGETGAKALDSLWEDDWDDDDVGDDFSVQLRGELLKQQEQMQT
ncbi:hypothetical protein JCM10213_001279 [Rhodosporidiobolus nylandii]